MKKYTIWLSYDLGFRTATQEMSQVEENKQYQERYTAFKPWLEEKEVQNLGDSVVLFSYEKDSNQKVEKTLKEEILKVFRDAKIDDLKGIRIYAIIAGEILVGNIPHLVLFYGGFLINNE